MISVFDFAPLMKGITFLRFSMILPMLQGLLNSLMRMQNSWNSVSSPGRRCEGWLWLPVTCAHDLWLLGDLVDVCAGRAKCPCIVRLRGVADESRLFSFFFTLFFIFWIEGAEAMGGDVFATAVFTSWFVISWFGAGSCCVALTTFHAPWGMVAV